jgi:hypothetical protein
MEFWQVLRFQVKCGLHAWVAKLVDAPGLGPDVRKDVPVRVRPQAPERTPPSEGFFTPAASAARAVCNIGHDRICPL